MNKVTVINIKNLDLIQIENKLNEVMEEHNNQGFTLKSMDNKIDYIILVWEAVSMVCDSGHVGIKTLLLYGD